MQTFWIIVTALAFNAAGLAAMFFYFRRRIRRTLELDEILDRARDEIGGMIAELNQTTDRNVSLLEDRIAAAAAAVESAEKRFGALSLQAGNRNREREMFEKLSRAGSAIAVQGGMRAADENAASRSPEPARSPEADMRTSPQTSGGRPIRRTEAPSTDGARQAGGTEADGGSGEAKSMPRVKKSATPVDTGLSAHDRVVRLWEQGFSSELIAPKLGMTIAETDLIIAMEEQRRLLGR